MQYFQPALMFNILYLNLVGTINEFFERITSGEMCDKVVDGCLPTLKFVHNQFIKNEICLNKLDEVVFSNDDTSADSDNVNFFSDDMGLNNKDLNNGLMMIILTMVIPKLIIHVKLMASCNRHKQQKTCKKT